MPFSIRTVVVAPLIAVLLGTMPARGQEASACGPEYDQAETAYFDAEFDRAIRLLQTCLEEVDLSPDAQIRFYRLLGFAHIAQGDRAQARTAVEQLLAVDPEYAPDPDTDRPDYVALVREVKADQPAEAQSDDGRPWLRWVIGGAAVVAGVLAAVLIGGGSGGNPDPDDDDDDFFPRPSVPIN